MPTETDWSNIEQQDLLMLVKNFAGQKITVEMVQRTTEWGYNRSFNMLDMAVIEGLATLVPGQGPMEVVFNKDKGGFVHNEELPLFSVKEDPPQLGQVVLAYLPTRRIGNGFEIIEWQEDDKWVYESWYPLVRPAT